MPDSLPGERNGGMYDWAKERDTLADMARVRGVPDSERPDGVVATEGFSGHKGIYLANLEGWLGGRFPALLGQRDELREALEELTNAAREFSTSASYTVEKGVEEEFVATLEHAEELLGE